MSPRAHLHGLGELHLVDEEGDKVPGGDGPRGHQLSPVAEEPQLQGQRRELMTRQGGHHRGMPRGRGGPRHPPRHGHLSAGTPRSQPCSITSPVPSRSAHVPEMSHPPMPPSPCAPEPLRCRAPCALMSPHHVPQPRATMSPCLLTPASSRPPAVCHLVSVSPSPVPTTAPCRPTPSCPLATYHCIHVPRPRATASP